jgi:hypothetical protein
MKTVHILDDIHMKLRIKSIHENKTLVEITNEILSSHLNTPTTSKEI